MPLTDPAAMSLLQPRIRRRHLSHPRPPVREVVGASHHVADLTPGLGEVAQDYLA